VKELEAVVNQAVAHGLTGSQAVQALSVVQAIQMGFSVVYPADLRATVDAVLAQLKEAA